MTYLAWPTRYDNMLYNRCGRSGIKLPAISLGLWHNFGGVDTLENCRTMLQRAFDLGITHFDLANNTGLPTVRLKKPSGRSSARISNPTAMSC
jgi:L-glyceraldehyde 3-phosphate reductase